jgi:hypothetical protein
MNDERRKALNKYLGEPYTTSEYTVANSGDLVSVRTVIQNRTFDNDTDMMALFRKMVDRSDALKIMEKDDAWFSFCNWVLWRHTCWSAEDYEEITKFLFYDPERFCNLVAEWLEVKK